MTDTELFEQSFQIAWSVLERTGELGEPNWSTNFLLDEIIARFRRGERRRLAAFKLRNRCVPAPANQTCLMIDPDCNVCLGIGWVCENRRDRRMSSCHCGAGMPSECAVPTTGPRSHISTPAPPWNG